MKNKKGNIMAMAMVVIIGVIVVGVIFGLISTQQRTTAIADDQFTPANGTCVSVTTNCIVAGSGVIRNATSGAIATGNFTACDSDSDMKLDGFTLNAIGGYPEFGGTTTNASYSERSCQALSGLTSTIVGYVPILLALGLLVFVAFYSMKF